jgi:hypothetical protein
MMTVGFIVPAQVAAGGAVGKRAGEILPPR